jgi:arylsulfatase A-like enzyme
MLGYRTICVSANPLLSEAINFNQGFQVFDNRINILNHLNFLKVFDYLSRVKIKRPIRGSKIKLFNNAELVTDYALDFIERYSNEPYFMFINYMDVHDPYIPPAKYREIYSKPYKGNYTGDICGDLSEAQFIKQHVHKMNKEDWDYVLSQYDGAIKYIDDQIERITRRLSEKGKLNNTLLVVLSDHGELFGEYGLATHHLTLSEEETHIPVIIHYPSVIKKPIRVKSLARIIDIYPTLQELLGFRMTENFFIEGVPLLNSDGEPTNKAGYAAMVLYENDYKASILGPAFRRNLFGYRVNDWKYLYPVKNRKFDWNSVKGEIFRPEQIEERLYRVDHEAREKLIPTENRDAIILLRSVLLEWREMIKKRNKNLGSAIESMEYKMKTILTGYNQPY